MTNVSLGTTVLSRPSKLEKLLQSVGETSISKVYIGDIGDRNEYKNKIYRSDYPFELTVLDLENKGLGYSRHKIVDASDEEYMYIVDSDMRVPGNIDILRSQLEADPSLGGVGGILMESDRIISSCYDLFEENGYLIKDIKEQKNIRDIAGSPFVKFDQIQNAAIFRRECLEDYSWDPNYEINAEHVDFFVGHMKTTNWNFGVCPEVLFRHSPGGDEQYMNERNSKKKIEQNKKYFLNKWGYRDIIRGNRSWIQSYCEPSSNTEKLANISIDMISYLPNKIKIPVWKLMEYAREEIFMND